MQILLISSSPHKEDSDTFSLAKEVLRGVFDEGGRCDIIHLAECFIDFCRHCQECHKKILHCPIKDSVPQILNAMLLADGIILASPNYINQITASMKALFERSTHFIHCKRLLGKYVAGVVSSGSGEDKDVLDYMKHYANICGAQYSGGVSSSERQIQDKLGEAYQLGKKLALDIKDKRSFSDQEKMIEYGYWRHKKWL
jgi:multimeric flavodoxin WrbA